MAELVRRGRAASPGLVIGPLVRRRTSEAAKPGAGSAEEERRRLRAALDRAMEELTVLAAADAGMGEEILAFQIAMLEDPALAEAAFAAVQAGAGAVPAWRACLDAQVAGYEAAED